VETHPTPLSMVSNKQSGRDNYKSPLNHLMKDIMVSIIFELVIKVLLLKRCFLINRVNNLNLMSKN